MIHKTKQNKHYNKTMKVSKTTQHTWIEAINATPAFDEKQKHKNSKI
jgi:hypothetical protein